MKKKPRKRDVELIRSAYKELDKLDERFSEPMPQSADPGEWFRVDKELLAEMRLWLAVHG